MVEVTAVFPLKFTIQELTLFPGIQSNNTELGVTFENDRFVGVGHVGASLTSKLSIAISPDQSEPLVPEILNWIIFEVVEIGILVWNHWSPWSPLKEKMLM